jgi:hypothetical protein
MIFPMPLAPLSHIHVAVWPGFDPEAEPPDPGVSILENPMTQQ